MPPVAANLTCDASKGIGKADVDPATCILQCRPRSLQAAGMTLFIIDESSILPAGTRAEQTVSFVHSLDLAKMGASCAPYFQLPPEPWRRLSVF